jgi:hypothetical protein
MQKLGIANADSKEEITSLSERRTFGLPLAGDQQHLATVKGKSSTKQHRGQERLDPAHNAMKLWTKVSQLRKRVTEAQTLPMRTHVHDFVAALSYKIT